MTPQSLIPVIIMTTAAAASFLLALFSWRWRSQTGGMYFLLLMSSGALFSFGNAAELASINVDTKILWARLSYLAVVNVPPLWLLFTSSYTQRGAFLQRYAPALWLVPIITVGLMWSNSYHGLFWTLITPLTNMPGSWLTYTAGPGLWLNSLYSYILVIVGILFLLRTAVRSPMPLRRQLILLIISPLFPWLASLVYLFKLNPWPGLDLTPPTLLVTNLLLAWTFYRYRMFHLVPAARDALFENMGDGVLVLDAQNCIIDINPTARRWIGKGDSIIGQDVFTVMKLGDAIRQIDDIAGRQIQLEIENGEIQRYFHLTLSPLHDRRGDLKGRIALLHDITRERILLDQERSRVKQIETINAITHAALDTPSFLQMLTMLAERLSELFGADGTFITIWDNENQRTIPTAAYGTLDKTYPELIILPGERTMTQSVLESGSVLTEEDTSNSPYINPRIAAYFTTCSMMGLPLIAGSQKLGAALISFDHPHQFSQEEIALGEQVAGQISLAVAKAKLYDAESKRAAQLSALQSVSQAVASSLELKQVFETVVHQLHHTFDYPFVSAYQFVGESLKLKAFRGYPPERMRSEHNIAHGILGRAVRSQQPQIIRDVAEDPDFLRLSPDIKSEICVPLMNDGKVVGLLNIEAASTLDETDLNLLITFGNHVVTAIVNASLFESERRQRELAEVLREVGTTLSESLNVETVLDRLLEGIKRVIPFDSAAILTVDDKRQNARVMRLANYDQYGEVTAKISAVRVLEIETTENLRFMTETRMPLIIPSTADYPGWVYAKYAEHIYSWAGAPIIVKGQVAAFLSLEKNEAGYFRAEHAELLRIFAGQAAVAMQNARLYDEVRYLSIIDELTGLYNRRGFFATAQREFRRALRHKSPLTVLFLDVDEFRQFNSIYSYAVGDQVLRLLSDCLLHNSREIDLAGRYGGDEFLILLPETDLAAAEVAAERVRCAVEALRISTSKGEVGFTISIGISQKTGDINNLESLVDCAGRTLQEAKNQGRNRVILPNLPVQ
jgi:diguanylate cyclase (GGDEF)-like protein